MKNTRDFIKKQTDKCVYCGICTTICPTYQLTQTETESPRARVISIKQVSSGQLSTSPRFKEQLNQCLQCGFCDNICPQKIQIVELISQAKNQYFTHKKDKYLWALKNAKKLNIGFLLIKPFLPKSLFLDYQKAIPFIKKSTKSTIAVFIGCTGNTLDKDTKIAVFELLNKLKIPFKTIKQEQCCGSLHYHEGDFKTYQKLQTKNQQALKNTQIDTLLYFASGCKKGINDIAKTNHIKAIEITDFISKQDFSRLSIKPFKKTVIVQTPCTHQSDATLPIYQILLSKIPNLKPIFAPNICCGAAGLKMIKTPKRAFKLRQPLVDFIGENQWVVSTNIGCRLHLAKGLKHNNVKIIHPISLLNQQIQLNL